jgi:hypothetical protein
MRRVSRRAVGTVGLLGNIAKARVGKFIPALVTGVSWRSFVCYSYATWANSGSNPDKKCIDMGSNSVNIRYTITSVIRTTLRVTFQRYTSVKETSCMSGRKIADFINVRVKRDSAVGIATRYGLECPRIESRLERELPHPSRPALRPCPASCTIGARSLSRD